MQCNHRHTVLGRRATGKPCDEGTGLYYFGARCYDPEVGRFTSPDPARDGLNWYIYCANNPLAYIDPDGKAADPITLGIGILWLAQWAPDLIDRLYVMAVDLMTMAATIQASLASEYNDPHGCREGG